MPRKRTTRERRSSQSLRPAHRGLSRKQPLVSGTTPSPPRAATQSGGLPSGNAPSLAGFLRKPARYRVT